jgi:endoglucanase
VEVIEVSPRSAGPAVSAIIVVIAIAPWSTPPSTGAGAESAFVRVDQVGYPSDAPKRAFLLAPVAEPGATFSVVTQDGAVVASGAVGERLGRWSAGAGDLPDRGGG